MECDEPSRARLRADGEGFPGVAAPILRSPPSQATPGSPLP